MNNFKIAVLAHDLIVFSIVLSANIAELCELRTVVKLNRIGNRQLGSLALLDFNNLIDLIGFNAIVFVKFSNF